MQHSIFKGADTLDMGRGVFQALCENKGIDLVRSGTTFAVSGYFPVLSLSFFVERSGGLHPDFTFTEEVIQAYDDRYRPKFGKVKLILPSIQASQIANIDRAVGLGGGAHEVGHIICDLANKTLSQNTKDLVIPKLNELFQKKPEYFQTLSLWANLCADIRLESMMSQLYPETKVRFNSIQEWIWNDIEKTSRENGSFNASAAQGIALIIRDFGKNHNSKSQAVVFEYYKNNYPELYKAAMDCKHLWQQLQVKIANADSFKNKKDMDKEIEKTVHLPLTIAIDLLLSLSLPAKNKQNKKEDQDKKQGQGNPSEDQSPGTGFKDPDSEDQESEGGEGNSSDKKDQDKEDAEESQGKGDKEDQEDQGDEEDQEGAEGSQGKGDKEDQEDEEGSQGKGDKEDKEDEEDEEESQGKGDPSKDDSEEDDSEEDEEEEWDADEEEDENGEDQLEMKENKNNSDNNGTGDGFNSEAPDGLDLTENININDINKVFKKIIEKSLRDVKYRVYVSNGLPIQDLEE